MMVSRRPKASRRGSMVQVYGGGSGGRSLVFHHGTTENTESVGLPSPILRLTHGRPYRLALTKHSKRTAVWIASTKWTPREDEWCWKSSLRGGFATKQSSGGGAATKQSSCVRAWTLLDRCGRRSPLCFAFPATIIVLSSASCALRSPRSGAEGCLCGCMARRKRRYPCGEHGLHFTPMAATHTHHHRGRHHRRAVFPVRLRHLDQRAPHQLPQDRV
jgi:hypothetical protein